MIDLIKLFKEIKDRPIFVPWKLKWNEQRGKFDKIPINGRSTKNPEHWTPLQEALNEVAGFNAACANEEDHLPGIGLVFTNGVHTQMGGDGTLVGFDFDDVDFDKFRPPFVTYYEKSPSGKGLRAFAWVPREWAARFQDSLQVYYPNCSHVEIYFGTSPRFLTLTGNTMETDYSTPWINKYDRIRSLGPETLKELAAWRGMKKSEHSVARLIDVPDGGKEIALQRFALSIEQRHLIEGTGGINRSDIIHGLIIMLIDKGETQADILATIIKQPALWQYALDHRHEDPDRALAFAKEEIQRAYLKSDTGRRANLYQIRKEEVVEEQQLAPVVPIRGEPDPEPSPATEQPASTFPLHLYDNAPGLVGEIARWIMQASHAPREEFAYACALSMMACLIGPYVTFGTRNGKTNLYVVLVGGTGTGKNEAIDPMCRLAAYTDAKDCIQDFPASEAALRRQLNRCPNVLVRADELAHKIDSFKDSSNGSLLSKAILEMYGGARLPPKQYADDKKSLPAVENPFVQILGGTTEKIWETLQTKHLEDGTLNRFIFVCLPDQAEYSANPRPSYKIEKVFKDRLNAFFRQSRKRDLLGYNADEGFGQRVEHAPEVQAALEALGPVMYAKQQQPFGELYSRFTLHVEKIAVILAVGDGRMTTSMDDYEQALSFMQWSVASTYAKASTKLAASTFERSMNRLIELVEKAGGKMRLRDLYRALNKPRKEMEELISTLLMGGRIKEIERAENKNGTETEWVYLQAPSEDE